MTKRPRTGAPSSGDWAKVAAALLVLAALGPFASALAAPAGPGRCCAESDGQLAAPPAPCQWITATSCCNSVGNVGSTPQPTSPPALLLSIASTGWTGRRVFFSTHEREIPPLERLALSTIVLLL